MQLEFKPGNINEYKIKSIWNSIIYAKKLVTRQLLMLYYLVLWKNYLQKENLLERKLVI